LVAAGSTDGTVTLWNSAGKEVNPLKLPEGDGAYNVAVAPNHGAVVCRSRSPKAAGSGHSRWPAKDRPGQKQRFPPSPRPARRECHKLPAPEPGAQGQVEEIHPAFLPADGARITSLAFSPDGHLLATVRGLWTFGFRAGCSRSTMLTRPSPVRRGAAPKIFRSTFRHLLTKSPPDLAPRCR